MPGIDLRAPLRQETSSGFSASPYFMPIASSVLARACGHFVLERLRELAAFLEVDGAELGGDGEAGGHGQAQAAHFGQVGPLAAREVLHAGIAIGAPRAETVYILLSHLLVP